MASASKQPTAILTWRRILKINVCLFLLVMVTKHFFPTDKSDSVLSAHINTSLSWNLSPVWFPSRSLRLLNFLLCNNPVFMKLISSDTDFFIYQVYCISNNNLNHAKTTWGEVIPHFASLTSTKELSSFQIFLASLWIKAPNICLEICIIFH